jgi:hypothetical protein
MVIEIEYGLLQLKRAFSAPENYVPENSDF